MEPEAINRCGKCRGMVTGDRKGDFACAFLYAASMDGHHDLLRLTTIGRLFLDNLAPLVAPPPLPIGHAFNVGRITIELGHGTIFVGSFRHIFELLETAT